MNAHVTFHSKKYDWTRLKAYLQIVDKLQDGETIPVTNDLEKYVRLQRFLRKHHFVQQWAKCRNTVVEIAVEFGLSPYQCACLYWRIQKISSRFSFGRSIESMERAGSGFKPLIDIQNAIRKVAVLSEQIIAEHPTPQMRIVEKKLENAAHFWAKRKLEEVAKDDNDKLAEIRALGFDHTVDGFYHNFDSHIVVGQWLRVNVLMAQLVREIVSQPQAPEDKTGFDLDSWDKNWIDDLSEIERLVGHVLPDLYERMTGNPFKLTQNKVQKAVLKDGTKFVSCILAAMQLEAIGPETIASHRKAVMKVKPKEI